MEWFAIWNSFKSEMNWFEWECGVPAAEWTSIEFPENWEIVEFFWNINTIIGLLKIVYCGNSLG